MTNTFKALLFDLDGTLLDTVTDLADAMNAILTKHHFPLKQYQDYKTYVGNGIKSLVIASLPTQARKTITIETCFLEMKHEYQARWKFHTKPYEEIAELLDRVAERKIPMAILSNKEETFTKKIVSYSLAKWPFA